MSLKKQLVVAAKERAEFARLYRDRVAAERRDEKVRELLEAAEEVIARHPSKATFMSRLRAAIAAVREEYTTDKGEPR